MLLTSSSKWANTILKMVHLNIQSVCRVILQIKYEFSNHSILILFTFYTASQLFFFFQIEVVILVVVVWAKTSPNL